MTSPRRRLPRLAAVLLLVGGLLATGLADEARAQQNPDLIRAARAYEQLQFKACKTAALRALRRPRNTRRDLIDLYRLLGLSSAALNEEEAAYLAFSKLLAIAPGYKLDPDLSPQLTSPFKEAKGVMGSRRPLGARLVPPAVTARPGQSNRLTVEIDDPLDMVSFVVFAYHRPGAASFSTVQVRKAGPQVTFDLPPIGAPTDERAMLEYYIELHDAEGGDLASAGSAAKPLTQLIGEPVRIALGARSGSDEPPPPFYKRVWFWAVVGGVVAASIAVPVALRPSGKVDLSPSVSFAR